MQSTLCLLFSLECNLIIAHLSSKNGRYCKLKSSELQKSSSKIEIFYRIVRMDKMYHVFISSTYTDLIEERKKVIDTILKMNNIPIGMEMFSANDDDQWAIIKKTIDLADYYLLIIGHRYGSMTNDGISYTEKEFNYAVSQNIPVLIFIRERNMKINLRKRELFPQRKELLKQFVQKAQSNKMVEYWKNGDELCRNVSISLHKIISDTPREGWIRSNIKLHVIDKLKEQNFELSKKIVQLQLQTEQKKPSFDLLINEMNSLSINFTEPSVEKVLYPQRLKVSDIPSVLMELVTIDDIEKYNSALPSNDQIDKYNSDIEFYELVKNNTSKIGIKVRNNGNCKANDARLIIKFPDELKIYKNKKVETVIKPKKLEMPSNPIDNGFKQLNSKKSTSSIIQSVMGKNPSIWSILTEYPRVNTKIQFPSSENSFISCYNTEVTSDCVNNELTIWIDSLLHKSTKTLEDEFYLVHFIPGNYKLKIEVICEELTELETVEFPIEVLKKE